MLAMVAGFIASFAAPASAAGGQYGSIQGVVIDAKTKAPVVGATISAASPTGQFRAVTDSRGSFSILGVNVDTYTVSIEAKGYEAYTLAGVTVFGDQAANVGQVSLSRQLTEIGRVRARSASAVYQPNQTVDSYTVSGERILQTAGKADATDETALALAVPGVSLTNTGNITIRGGLRTEVGYQFDGVDFTEPFFSQNASNNRYAGIASLQVVEGAGDATQGNVGGGVFNLIPKRGTYPADGLVDVEAGQPNYFHQFAFDYGFATPNGRISDYFAYNGQRDVPYYGWHNADAASYDNFYGVSYEASDQLVNNFIYKFGHNNNQSLQILYLNSDLQQYGNTGGITTSGPNATKFYPADPYNPLGTPFLGADYTRLIGLNPGVTSSNNYQVYSPEESSFNPTRYLKFEYDNALNATTFLQARYYNWETLQGGSNNTGCACIAAGFGLGAYPTWNQTGGPRVGGTLDITKQFGSKNILTLATKYENAHPVWDGYDPNAIYFLMLLGIPGTAQIGDFLPGGYLSTGNTGGTSFFPNGIPRIPVSGINYNGAWYQTFGIGLRDQWAPSDKFKADFGVRVDGQNQNFGPNPLNTYAGDQGANDNPSDVNPTSIGRKYLDPREVEPRLAFNYQFDNSDAIRAGYGRSVVFLNAQTSGTPGGMYNFQPFLNVPATDSLSNPACGSGKNLTVPGPTHLWKCANYAEELYWLYDQNFDAPDLGGALPAIYNNYDFTFQHQFKDGIGMRITPFYKLGTNLPSFALLTGLSAGAAVFTVNNEGINRTSGLEFGLNTPERAYGFNGFFSATYQNVIGSTPPLIGGEDALPINGSGSLGLNDTYRAGYVSPVSLRIGGDYKTKSGWRFAPTLQYDRGYPYSVGNTIATNCAPFTNAIQTNFGCAVNQVPGYQSQSGTALSTNYVDPANPGTQLHPNIAWTRGTPATSSSGGVLWVPNLRADFTTEYTSHGNTFGVSIRNLFGNAYNGQVPILNPYYQPVANGLSGPLTGVNPYSAQFPNRGFANVPTNAYAFSNGAYLLIPNQPTTFTFYLQRKL
jgi:hypothetical protein